MRLSTWSSWGETEIGERSLVTDPELRLRRWRGTLRLVAATRGDSPSLRFCSRSVKSPRATAPVGGLNGAMFSDANFALSRLTPLPP